MRILAKVDNKHTGMYYHRVASPFSRMNETYTYQFEAIETETKITHVQESDLAKFDAVFYSRTIELDGTTDTTCDYLHLNGKKIIFDIDDYWHLEPTHYLAKSYKYNRIPEQTLQAIKRADLIFCPTPYMAEVIRPHNSNVHVVKTAINPNEGQWASKSISSDLTRFGWIGGIHHLNDIKVLEKSISKVHQGLRNYQLCVGGYSYDGKNNGEYLEIEKIFTSNYKVTDHHYNDFLFQYSRSLPDHLSYFKNYRRLWDRDVNNYGRIYDEIDVSLVPLANTGRFNQYKSELKLIEAGTKGKMAIVSKVKPYTLVPDEVVHFIEPGDISGWYKAIKYCLENKEYVKEKAQALKEYIRENYNLDAENKKRYELIKSIL